MGNRYFSTPPVFRFHKHTTRDQNGCLIWTGTRDAFGYGMFYLNRKRVRAHR